MALEAAAAIVRLVEDVQRRGMQHRLDARAHQLRDVPERVALADLVYQVRQHLLLLVRLAEEPPVERRLQLLAGLKRHSNRADEREIDPAGSLQEDLRDGAVRVREDRK